MRRVPVLLLAALSLLAAACSGSRPTLDENAGVPREVEAEAEAIDDTPEPVAEPVELRLAVGTPWSGDPADAGPASIVTLVLADLLHEGLTTLDASGAAAPALAESWTVSEDRLTWTFTLAADAVDADGTPVTARDVMASLDHVAARGPADHAAVALTAVRGWSDRMNGESGGVAGLAAPDEQHLVITLDQVFEPLPEVLAAPAFGILPPGEGDTPRTTGDYRYADEGVLAAVDPDAAVAEIVLVDAENAAAELYAAGEVDWAVLPAGSAGADLPGHVVRQPLDIRVGIVSRLADDAARHAVLDRIDPLGLTAGIVAFAPLPSSTPNAGEVPEAVVPVDVPAGRLEAVGAALADQLSEAGFEVERVESDAAGFSERVASGDAVVFPIVIAGVGGAVAEVLRTYVPGGVDDLWGTESAVRSDLGAAIAAERDPEERALFVEALEDAMVDEGLLRMIGRLEVRVAVGSRLSGLIHAPDGTLVLDAVVEATASDDVDG